MSGMRHQPQGRVRLNTLNPIAQAVVGTIAGSVGADVFGARVMPFGSITSVGTPAGNLFSGFNGNVGTRVEAEHPLMSGAFTVAFTLLFQRRSSTQVFVAQGGSGAGGRGWAIGNIANSNGIQFTLGGVADYNLAPSSLTPNEVHRIVIRVSGNGGTARAWVNGSLAGTVNIGTMLTPAGSSTIIGASANNATGGRVAPLGNGNAVGDLVLINRAVSDQEGQSLSNRPSQIFKSYAIDSAGEFAGRVELSSAWTEQGESTQLALSLRGSSTIAWREDGENQSNQIVVTAPKIEPALSIAWAEQNDISVSNLAVSGRANVSWVEEKDSSSTQIRVGTPSALRASWIEQDEGFQARIEIKTDGDIDASLVPSRQTVVFEGSRRVVSFEGSKRVVSFEGSKKIVEFP